MGRGSLSPAVYVTREHHTQSVIADAVSPSVSVQVVIGPTHPLIGYFFAGGPMLRYMHAWMHICVCNAYMHTDMHA